MSFIIADRPMQFLPELAIRVGLEESIFVQELHYLLRQQQPDSKEWVSHLLNGSQFAPEVLLSYSELRSVFPFWSCSVIKRVLMGLVRNEVVILRNKGAGIKFFLSLDYDRLSSFATDQRGTEPVRSRFQ